jgi:hypothetical protein
MALAGALASIDRSPGLVASRRRLAIAWVIASIVVVRFAVFTYRGAAGDVAGFEAPRTYLRALEDARIQPKDGVVTVPAPADPGLDRQHLDAMLRWIYRQPHLTVVVR